MIDETQHRMNLYEEILLDFLYTSLEKYVVQDKKIDRQKLQNDLAHYAGKCLDIERADFTSNYNGNHGQEQGAPF